MFFWKKRILKDLRKYSQVIDTAMGPIEFAPYGGGPVVVGIHGTPGGYDQISVLCNPITQHGFELISWSRPGYLRTPLNVGKTFDKQAEALASLLDVLGIEKVAIFAISGGGPVAVEFAIRYPKRIWALVLQSAICKKWNIKKKKRGKFLGYFFQSDFGMRLLNMYADYSIKSFVNFLLSVEGNLDKKTREKLVEKVVKDPQKVAIIRNLIKSMSPVSVRRNGLRNDLRQLARLPDLAFEKVSCPTLIIHGTKDADVPFDHAEYAASLIPNVEMIAVEGGTHLLPLVDEGFKAQSHVPRFFKKHGKKHLF